MTTSYSSLIDRVRAELGDYGDAITTLSSNIGSASQTSIPVANVDSISVGSFIQITHEVMFVTAVNKTTRRLTVIRGMQGTTAAPSHAAGSLVYVNLDYSDVQIYQAINSALSWCYPKLYVRVEDTSNTTTSGVYEYELSSPMDHICRVEIENSDLSGQYNVDRYWDVVGPCKIRLYGDRAAGRTIRVLGRKKFDSGSITGNIDSNFPDTDENAIAAIVKFACSELLLATQGRVGQLDAFQGNTDRFTANQPYVPINTSRQYREQAELLLRNCAMEPLAEYFPHPTRRMYKRN